MTQELQAGTCNPTVSLWLCSHSEIAFRLAPQHQPSSSELCPHRRGVLRGAPALTPTQARSLVGDVELNFSTKRFRASWCKRGKAFVQDRRKSEAKKKTGGCVLFGCSLSWESTELGVGAIARGAPETISDEWSSLSWAYCLYEQERGSLGSNLGGTLKCWARTACFEIRCCFCLTTMSCRAGWEWQQLVGFEKWPLVFQPSLQHLCLCGSWGTRKSQGCFLSREGMQKAETMSEFDRRDGRSLLSSISLFPEQKQMPLGFCCMYFWVQFPVKAPFGHGAEDSVGRNRNPPVSPERINSCRGGWA